MKLARLTVLVAQVLALLALLCLAPFAAHATTYYISDCQTGAATACVAGDDTRSAATASNSATPWKTCTKLSSQYPNLLDGDAIRFAKGSVQTGCSTAFLDNTHVTGRAGRVTIGSYTPAWTYTDCTYTGGSQASSWANNPSSPCELPLIQNTSTIFWFGENTSGGANPIHQRWAPIITGLHLKGARTESGVGCIRIGAGSDYGEITNNEIESCYNGVEWQVNAQYSAITSGNGMSDYGVMSGNYIHDNSHNGVFGANQYGIWENNLFDGNGNTAVFDHNVYIGGMQLNGTETTTNQLVVRGNTLTHNTLYYSGGDCGSSILVAHGFHDGLRIENNAIGEATAPVGANKGNCYGIDLSPGYANTIIEGFNHVVVRNNKVFNAASGIMLDSVLNAVVENNSVYSTYASSPFGIDIRSGAGAVIDTNKSHPTAVTIRNNSIYLTSPSSAVKGISVTFNASDTSTGSGYNVVSNLIRYGSGTGSTAQCFNTQNALASQFTTWDNNLCYYSGTAGLWMRSGTTASPTDQTKAQWNAATGFDANSLTTDPTISAPSAPAYSLCPASGPAIGAGHASASSGFAYGGYVRSGTPDIGSCQLGASSIYPNPPDWVQ
jgi:hypothetical protein